MSRPSTNGCLRQIKPIHWRMDGDCRMACKDSLRATRAIRTRSIRRETFYPMRPVVLTSMSGYGTCMQVSASRSIRQSVLKHPLLPSNTTPRCGINGVSILPSMLCGASTTTICSTSPSIPIQCFRAIGQP